jgi:hypothetical protein
LFHVTLFVCRVMLLHWVRYCGTMTGETPQTKPPSKKSETLLFPCLT